MGGDDVITGLSRANPEYAGVLFGMLDRFEEAIPADLGRTADTRPDVELVDTHRLYHGA
jgi:hypothetical protein